MPNLETYKPEDEMMPDAEKADMSVSPVTAEEMAAAMAALNETNKDPVVEQKVKDKQAIENLRQTLSGVPETPEPNHGDDEGPELEPIIMHEAETTFTQCEVCHGTGRKWLILNCPGCGGMGSVPEHKPEFNEKIVGWRPKSDDPDHLNI
ncbi:MAG: hypothetical protein AAB610_01835 [Patescibacteria group bacterium]